MFKKSKIKKCKKQKRIINYITYIGLIIVFLLSIFILNKIDNGDFNIYNNLNNIETKKITQKEKIEIERKKADKIEKEKKEKELKIKKELDKKKENILIIGRGGYGNDAPELTDSLILLSYFKEKQQISMLSIPRDLYVEYGDKNRYGKDINAKINGLYVHYLAKYHNEEKAIKKLEEKIEEITGEKIDFYINIDFNGFIKLINAIDGITVNVKRNLYDDKYPDNNHGFQTFSMSKGIKRIYGQTALMYARTRKNTGGDFGRSERQQQILKAIKQKVLSSEYLTSPSKINKLYNIFDKYITTDIGIINFTKLATNIKLQDNINFYSSTLNTSCIRKDECDKGGFLYYPQRKFFGGQSVVLPNGADNKNLSNYNEVQNFSTIVFNSPNLFKEDFKISIFSKKEDLESALDLKYQLKKYGFELNILERIGLIPDNKSDLLSSIKNTDISLKKNKITLAEYNKLKNKPNFDIKNYNPKKVKKINYTNGIDKEADNKNTKIIINGVDINSNTIKFLKEYLNLDNNDILVNIDGPKYARDKNTDIEILYKK